MELIQINKYYWEVIMEMNTRIKNMENDSYCKLDKAHLAVTKQRRFIESQTYDYSMPCICQHGNSCGERIPNYDKAEAVRKADLDELKRLQNIVTKLQNKYGIR